MKSRGPTFGVLVFYSIILTIALVVVLGNISPERRMTGNRVSLHTRQLALMAQHTEISTPGTDDPCNLTYTFGEPGFSIQCLAYINQFTRKNQPGLPETHLWFAIDGIGPRLSRNTKPSRGRSLLLVRDETNSDLVQWPNPRQLIVSVSPFPKNSQKTQQHPISVNNDLGSPAAGVFRSSHSGFIDAVTTRREDLNTRDAHIFSLLARILRPRVCDNLDSDSTTCYDTLLTIQRGGPRRIYLITLRHLRENRGNLRLKLKVSFNKAGTLQGGHLSIIGKSATLSTPADIFITHPRPNGELLTSEDKGFASLRWEPNSKTRHPASTTIRFAPLLRDTNLPRE